MSRLPSRVTIELAPNDARRLVALTAQIKGYDIPSHRADVASDLLREALSGETRRADVSALVVTLRESAGFYYTQLDLPYQTAEDRERWQANITAFEAAADALSTLLTNGAI